MDNDTTHVLWIPNDQIHIQISQFHHNEPTVIAYRPTKTHEILNKTNASECIAQE